MIYRRLYREDNSIIDQSQIKSFHYHVQSNQNGNLRPGSVISSFIEVELFTSGGNLPDIGEKILYARGYDNDDGFIQNHFPNPPEYYPRGTFIVTEKHISSNDDLCTIIAYDQLKNLEKSYAERLLELKANGAFPMLAKDLLNDAITYAGLTWDGQSINVFNISVNSFYSDSITCRDIVSAVSELVGLYVKMSFTPDRVDVDGLYDLSTFHISPYYPVKNYIICPTDQIEYRDEDDNVLIPAYYKQDGFTLSDYEVQAVDDVFIYNSSGLLLGRTYNSNDPQNIYYVTDNIIANNTVLDSPIPGTDLQLHWCTAAGSIYNNLNRVLPYRPMSIKMFPFRCPYELISKALVVDKDGTRYTIPVMSIDEDNYGVTIASFGQDETQTFTNEFVTTDQRATSLDIRLNKLQQESSASVDAISGILANKNVLLIGDSISNPDYDSDPSWSNYFSTMLTDIGSTLTTVAYNGRGYVRQTGGYNFLTVMQTLTLSDYDVIIVFGGINDFAFDIPIGQLNLSTADVFDTNVNAVNALIKASGALGVIISPIPSNNTRTDKLSLGFFGKALRSAAQRDGLLFVDGGAFPSLPVDGSGLIDSTHPLASVREPMARHIFDKILSGGDSQYSECDLIYAPNKTADVGSATYTMRMYFNGDSIFLQINGTVSTAGVVRINLPPFNVFLTDGFRGVVGTTAVNMQINAGNPGQFVINAANPAATGSFNVIREVASLSTQAFKTITY